MTAPTSVRDGRSLRRRLGTALVAGGVALGVLAGVAGTALVVMRDRQDAITGTYFRAVTEVDAGHILLLDAEAAIDSYLATGNASTLDVLDRIAESPEPEVDVGAELARELGADHPVLRLRAAATAALDTWYGGHVQPLVAVVQEAGPSAVDPADLRAEDAAFAALEDVLDEYTTAVREAREDANDQLRQWIGVTSVASGLLVAGAAAAGVALWVSLRRWVTDPLAALASEARVVAGGDVHHRVDVTGPGEVGDLAGDVELMRERLVVLLDESARAREELEASHAALEEQAEELRRSNRDLEQFAYVASHDLQEPLRKVASFTQLLSSRYRGQLDERADQYIDFAVDGAKRMQRLINDLLGFSRVGRIGTEVTDVDMRAVVDQVVADLGPLVEETGAQVTAGELPTVRGEAPLLVQLVANLVGNAVKFRRPGVPPVVRLEAERVGDVWQFSCRDNGIGIDPQYAERVFVIFQRLHAKEVYEGTGIGLALCKKIVEYHGGDIWVDQAVGEGSVVRWTLPAAPAPGTTVVPDTDLGGDHAQEGPHDD
ncbi:sensor histidine kinase [Actinotalea fermentans]|uniref:sensor histidine kinase n=1 Tax=Actinotalea fermentans TaxID=43671 RepID=UPI0021BEFA22|nr:ATP-binding protein [Actinotalea fermentans]